MRLHGLYPSMSAQVADRALQGVWAASGAESKIRVGELPGATPGLQREMGVDQLSLCTYPPVANEINRNHRTS
ncbi:MAG: hypothetical protein K0R39_783 [Symbiobacteriaceae bacterium]|nr:hypothetical protein [Symbiobacteriaceae bacterium]